MEAALGPATSLVGKVLTMLSNVPMAAYVDSLELGHNSEQIKAKLTHTRGLLQIAQRRNVMNSVPALEELLAKLARMTEEAENSLNEVHYFQIHDKLHSTIYANTQEAGRDMGGVVCHQALHARSALRHTFDSLLQCFSCSPTQDGADDSSVAGAPRGDTNSASAETNSASADGDKLHFDRVSVSRKIKSVLQDMQIQCDSVSDLLSKIPSSSSSSAVAVQRPQIGSMIIQDTLYGRRDTFENTVSRIISCEQIISVLPIVGPGGIGKTTFTQHLYNDARAEKHFKVRVWVCVSTDFNVCKLTREILGCILAPEGGSSSVANETTNLDQLQKSIAHRLKSKRFLIVLDDIWKCDGEDQWKTLLAPFTKGEVDGSMVLVTTRFPKLAQMIKTTETLELAGREYDDFFTFFEACILGEHKTKSYDNELAGIGRKIANKLKDSPLAAKTVGRLLQKDLSQDHWNGVLKNHEWLKQQDDYDIMPSLKISYNYLHFDLKKCFSYFGLFPEDHRFYYSEMNHLFAAIGITDSHQVGRNYLEELVDNGFLMKKVCYWGRHYYVMHDLMHELSKSVSTQDCLNICDLDFRADAIPQSVRHLSITIKDRYDVNFEEEMFKLRGRIDIANLRTLMIFGEYEERIAKILKDCFKENSLRVLFIAVNSPECFPSRFSRLIHLQYLKISSSYASELSLPSTLSRFYHLKFLDLVGWRGRSDLPKDFSHLENLHDFRARSELHSNICNVGKIKHLRELQEFHVKKESMGFELSELGALTELEGELIICDLDHVETKEEATAAKLILKRNLKELKLLWNRDQPTIDADSLDALRPHSNLRALTIENHSGTIGPSWLCLDIWLTSLETLTLDGVSWSTLPPFGKIPNLKVLNSKRISGVFQFRCGGVPGKCFNRLKRVVFDAMPELAEWVVEPNCHSFLSIEIIKCIDCPNLRVMPLSDVSCTNLCRLEVSGCPKMSLPSMPHTFTLTYLYVRGVGSDYLFYDGKRLVVGRYCGDLAFHNLDKVEDLTIWYVSHVSWTDIKKLKVLRKLDICRCDGLFPEELDGSIVFRSVESLSLGVNHLTRKSLSEVLNCFPALSVLKIDSDLFYGERVMMFPSSSSLQKLRFELCKGLVLVPVENGGGIQEDNSSLLSLEIHKCGELFSRWPMGGAETIYPFPASLRELVVLEELSMKSMAMLSNLTSLTRLRLVNCSNLTVDGFNPLITVNLEELELYNDVATSSNTVGAADLLSEVARTKLMPAGYISRLKKLTPDNISGLLVAPICNLLAPALCELKFYEDKQAENFTEEQAKALQLLTSLQKLEFSGCERLQSLPQGLHRMSSLKEVNVIRCQNENIIRLLMKERFPVSPGELVINFSD